MIKKSTTIPRDSIEEYLNQGGFDVFETVAPDDVCTLRELIDSNNATLSSPRRRVRFLAGVTLQGRGFGTSHRKLNHIVHIDSETWATVDITTIGMEVRSASGNVFCSLNNESLQAALDIKVVCGFVGE